jgi:hypothetical protein
VAWDSGVQTQTNISAVLTAIDGYRRRSGGSVGLYSLTNTALNRAGFSPGVLDAFQRVDLTDDRRGFILKHRALRLVVFRRILAGFVLEV